MYAESAENGFRITIFAWYLEMTQKHSFGYYTNLNYAKSNLFPVDPREGEKTKPKCV